MPHDPDTTDDTAHVPGSRRTALQRAAATAGWAYAVWILLTWTATPEQLVFGAVLAVLVGLALVGTGPVVGPWALFRPRRLAALLALAGTTLGRIVVANVALSRRIWAPSRPLRSGMIVVRSGVTRDGELAALGSLTSLVVDNQLVDLDRSRGELQYHAVAVPGGDRSDTITRPVERWLELMRG